MIAKGVTYESGGRVLECIFCDIIAKRSPAAIIFEDNEIIVFKTIQPATPSLHALVVPKMHIRNVNSLTREHVSLLETMRSIGREVLQKGGFDETDSRMVFHVPPYNSIDHLHLHVIATQSKMTFLSSLKYYAGLPWCDSIDNRLSKLLLSRE